MADSSKNRTLVSLGCLIILCIVTITVWQLNWADKQSPDVNLQTIDGRNIRLSTLQGGPVVLTFWATTCDICVKKIPELSALYRQFQPLGMEIIAIAMSYDPPNRILSFSKNRDLPYPVALDIDGSLAAAFDDVDLTPTTFLIDAGGKIVFDHRGDFEIDVLERKILEILKPESEHSSLTSI
ncbi:MAG: redoxin domain-containing protein [Gammaproteobacteria bacterium]|nr:redoxin domain-containing protein [Gammaproteobacteria bacterium]